MEQVILGFCPTRRNLFSAEDARKYKEIIKNKLNDFPINVIDIDDITNEGLLVESVDLDKVIKKFSNNKIDALFIPHCNFGTEDLVTKVAKALGVPVLLWGPRDESPDESGLRLRDSQCGLFATGKVLRRFNVPFTYINNCRVDTAYFADSFNRFIAVANVVKHFRRIKILQISTRPTSFWSVIANESELLEKFGIETYPIPLRELLDKAENIRTNKGSDYDKAYDYIKNSISKDGKEEDISKMAALKCALKERANFYNCNSIAIQCWSALQDEIGIMPCVANSILSEEQLPCVCETDICGAVTAVMVQAATLNEKPHFFSDVTIRHPENDNAELLWHCGPFPYSLAKDKDKAKAAGHWILPSGAYGTCEWEIKGGDITIARFDGDHGKYSLFTCEGKGVDGPFTRGTYVWFEVKNWPKVERKLVEGPYIHHVAGIHGKYAEILYEACKYIPGLQPDPTEPTMDELINRWSE